MRANCQPRPVLRCAVADVGVKLDWAIWAGLGMFVIGLLMTVGAVIVILLIGRRADRESTTG